MIKKYNSNEAKFHLFNNRKIKLTGLEKNQEYEIATCNGPDTIMSPIIKVKTFTSFDRPFTMFTKMVETNQNLLLYKDIQRYYTIINRAKDLAIDTPNFQSATDSIIQFKNRYEIELKNLNKDDVNYNEKRIELTHNIYVCNELIYLSNKVQNNTLSVVNKESIVNAPTMFYNDQYETCFTLDKDFTLA